MIILVLKDGLGNQLFQYAAAKCLAVQLNTTLKLDIDSFKKNSLRNYALNNFQIEEHFVSAFEKTLFRIANGYSRLLNLAGINVRSFRYFKKELGFNPDFFRVKNNTCVEGYWQSPKNFEKIKDIVRLQFRVRTEPENKNRDYIQYMSETGSVSVHIRRGDYVSDPTTSSIHGVCSLDYYRKAVSYIRAKVETPVFFVFSDDMEWVKGNLEFDGCEVQYIEHNGEKDFEDLRLMYSCKHNIIANSSFSWWGAWLNNNPDKIVIAPQNWFKSTHQNSDLLPLEWHTI
jgi:hypothetical protein